MITVLSSLLSSYKELALNNNASTFMFILLVVVGVYFVYNTIKETKADNEAFEIKKAEFEKTIKEANEHRLFSLCLHKSVFQIFADMNRDENGSIINEEMNSYIDMVIKSYDDQIKGFQGSP